MNHTKHLITTGLALLALLLAACGTPGPDPASTTITLYYEGAAQFELIGPQGTRVLIDVYDSSALSSPAAEGDVLLTTHGHSDHVEAGFSDNFPGQQLRMQEGTIDLPDVTIRGITASHGSREPDGSNYIFIIDMAGMRIAHFGDIGQEQLTPEQLEALGEVDIALTQLANSYSQMSLMNEKGFKLMAQVNPKLVIPTHGGADLDVIARAIEEWPDAYVGTGLITISRADLDGEPKFLVLGDDIMVAACQKLYELPLWQD